MLSREYVLWGESVCSRETPCARGRAYVIWGQPVMAELSMCHGQSLYGRGSLCPLGETFCLGENMYASG